jgi:hypothetical protein
VFPVCIWHGLKPRRSQYPEPGKNEKGSLYRPASRIGKTPI